MGKRNRTLKCVLLSSLSTGSVIAAGANLLTFTLAVSAAGDALGQTPKSSGDSQLSAVQTSKGSSLEQIVVTARRRSERLSKVPVAVTALGSSQLKANTVTKETDLQASVAGLTVKTTGSQNQLNYTIRGQTLDAFSGSSPGVLPYLNDVFVDSQTATSFYDLASVQVLKGPQGTLFGRNATGGAVLYNTQQPGDTYSGYLTARVGNYGLNEYQGAVDVPILPGKIDLRVAGDIAEGNGYVKNLTSGGTLGDTDSKSGRVTLKLHPTEKFTSTTVLQYGSYGGTELIGELYSYNKVGATNGGYVLNDTAASLYPGPLGIARELAQQKAQGPYNEALQYEPTHYSRNLYLANTSTYEVTPDITLKNIVSYSNSTTRTDQPLSGAPLGVLDLLDYPFSTDGIHYQIDQWSEEFQLQGKAFNEQLNYILGVYAASDTDHSDIPTVVGIGLPGGPLEYFHHDSTDVDRTQAIYAQGTYNLAQLLPGLSFTAGGRETWEYLVLSQGPFSNFAGYPDQNAHEASPSWQVGLEYQVTPTLLVYAANRGSWRAGNFNGTTTPVANQNEFGPEHTHDFEIGTKFNGRLLDRPAFFNLALYDQLVQNVQRDVYFDINGAPSSLTANVPKATIQGIELDGQFRATDWMLVGVNGAYTYANYTDGSVTIFGQSLRFTDYQDTPRWTGSAFAQFDLPAPERWGAMTFRSSVYYQTDQYFTSLNSTIAPGTKLPSYALVDLRYDWRDMFGSKFSLGLFAKNLLDRAYYLGGFGLGPDVGFNTAIVGAPRTFGAELNYTF